MTLTQENIEHFLQGCPEIGSLVARTTSHVGWEFHLFPIPFPTPKPEFKFNNGLYHTQIGTSTPANTSKEEFSAYGKRLIDALQFKEAPIYFLDNLVGYVSSKLQ